MARSVGKLSQTRLKIKNWIVDKIYVNYKLKIKNKLKTKARTQDLLRRKSKLCRSFTKLLYWRCWITLYFSVVTCVLKSIKSSWTDIFSCKCLFLYTYDLINNEIMYIFFRVKNSKNKWCFFENNVQTFSGAYIFKTIRACIIG